MRTDLPASFPVWPLAATLATQSLATMAAYSFSVVAPVIAKDLQTLTTRTVQRFIPAAVVIRSLKKSLQKASKQALPQTGC
jgi:hypothetical protein